MDADAPHVAAENTFHLAATGGDGSGTLGHSSVAQTLSMHSHPWPEASDRTRKAMGELLDQVLGSSADALRTTPRKYLPTRR